MVLLLIHWLKNWRNIFEPTTKRSHYNGAITIDNHLKTALSFDGKKSRMKTGGFLGNRFFLYFDDLKQYALFFTRRAFGTIP